MKERRIVIIAWAMGGPFMIRSELVAKTAAENPNLTQADAERIVLTIFESIIETLANGGRVELRFCSRHTQQMRAT